MVQFTLQHFYEHATSATRMEMSLKRTFFLLTLLQRIFQMTTSILLFFLIESGIREAC